MPHLEPAPQTHIALIEISINGGGSSKFEKIKSELSYYMRIIKQGRFSHSIDASAPSGMIGRYCNVHQWIRCETERKLEFIHQVCDNLSSRYYAKLCLYKWDNEYLTRTKDGIWINLGDPI